jgi:hypothetical protein
VEADARSSTRSSSIAPNTWMTPSPLPLLVEMRRRRLVRPLSLMPLWDVFWVFSVWCSMFSSSSCSSARSCTEAAGGRS